MRRDQFTRLVVSQHTLYHSCDNLLWSTLVQEEIKVHEDAVKESSSLLAGIQAIAEKIAVDEQKYLQDYARKQRFTPDPYPLFSLAVALVFLPLLLPLLCPLSLPPP